MLQDRSSVTNGSAATTIADVIGAGIAGTWQALALAKAGCRVAVFERDDAAMSQATSHFAGGMLAPWCEGESAEPVITRLGARSLDLWREELPDTPFNGSLVVAHPRDRADFDRFARLSSGHERLSGDQIATLEPALAGRFRDALFFEAEGHVEPRRVLPLLHERLQALGIAMPMCIDRLAQEREPHRVHPVEHRRRALRVPPVPREPAEMLGFARADGCRCYSCIGHPSPLTARGTSRQQEHRNAWPGS